MRVALVQLDVSLTRSAGERVARATELVRTQRGADLVVLPELWVQGAWAYQRWAEGAETLDGPSATALADAARETGAHVHMGSSVERADDGRLFNTSQLFAPDGTRLASYRKIHRFGFDEGEAAVLSAGAEPVVVATQLGTLGLATCYDLRFPELFRALLDRGAEIAVVASAWPSRRLAHWRLLAQARAVEQQMYVLACNATGTHEGVAQAGHSLVVDPWGEIVAEAGDTEDVIACDIEQADVAKTREAFPVLRDRRFDLWARL